MKKSYIIAGVVIVIALVFAMFSFKSTLTTYVTIQEAKANEQYVQVAGELVQESTRIDGQTNQLIFTIKEPSGDEMVIHYNKSKPANFENAEKIVAVGKYDKSKQAFIANELLVKCPSKYEGRLSEK